ncbi:hypothetical protein ACLKA6_010884 [Drosophila palustris]
MGRILHNLGCSQEKSEASNRKWNIQFSYNVLDVIIRLAAVACISQSHSPSTAFSTASREVCPESWHNFHTFFRRFSPDRCVRTSNVCGCMCSPICHDSRWYNYSFCEDGLISVVLCPVLGSAYGHSNCPLDFN